MQPYMVHPGPCRQGARLATRGQLPVQSVAHAAREPLSGRDFRQPGPSPMWRVPVRIGSIPVGRNRAIGLKFRAGSGNEFSRRSDTRNMTGTGCLLPVNPAGSPSAWPRNPLALCSLTRSCRIGPSPRRRSRDRPGNQECRGASGRWSAGPREGSESMLRHPAGWA